MIFISLAFGICAGLSLDQKHVLLGYTYQHHCEVQHEWDNHTYGYIGDRRAFVEILEGGATVGIEDLEFTLILMDAA